MSEHRLLEVAIAQFGLHGFEGASTRAIAAEAGTVMSSITYHYGGKEGLYHAAARHIARAMSSRVEPTLARCDLTPRARLLALVDRLTALMLAEEAESWSRFISREQMQPTHAFDLLWSGGMGRVVGETVRLTRIVTGTTPERARFLALGFLGIALVHRVGRATVLCTLEWDAIDAQRASLVRAHIADMAGAILDAEAARAAQGANPCPAHPAVRPC